MSFFKSTVGGSTWTLLNTAIVTVFQLVVFAVLARYLDKTDFGIVAITNIIMAFCLVFSEIGLGPALVYKKDITKVHVTTAFYSMIMFSILVYVIVFFFSGMISQFFSNDDSLVWIIRVASISLVFNGFSVTSISLLQKNIQFKQIFFVEVLAYLFGYLTPGIYLAINGYGVWAIIVAQLSTAFLRFVIGFAMVRHSLVFDFGLPEFRSLFKFGSGLTLTQILTRACYQLDKVIVGKVLGQTTLGIYERIGKIVMMPSTIVNKVLHTVLFSTVSKIQDDKEKVGEYYKYSVAIVAAFMIPLSLFFIIVTEDIVAILLGDNWSEAVFPLQILFSAISMRALGGISDAYSKALGVVYSNAYRKFIFLLAIVVCVFMGSYYGLVGAVIAVDISITINFLLMVSLIGRVTGRSLFSYLLRA